MGTDLRASAREYLTWRRAMGYQLSRHDGLIDQFLDYLQHQHQSRISVEDALTWACLPRGTRPRWHSARLAVIRGFAAHVHAHAAEAAELIPAGVLPSRVGHAIPYLYTPTQLTNLITRGIFAQLVTTTFGSSSPGPSLNRGLPEAPAVSAWEPYNDSLIQALTYEQPVRLVSIFSRCSGHIFRRRRTFRANGVR